MNKAIVIDIDGVLSDSWEDQKECFCGDTPLGEKEYFKRLPNLPIADWAVNMIKMYTKTGYHCFLLTARPVILFNDTMTWLENKFPEYQDYIWQIIFQTSSEETHACFKLNILKEISKKYDIDFILEDDPRTVKLLHENNFRALLTPTLYEWEPKF